MGTLSSLWPSGKISFHFSENNQLFLTKKGKDEPQQVTLIDLCREATPPTCQLNPFLFNGHLQTVWTTVKNVEIPIHYRRKVFEAENPHYAGQFAVDFVVAPFETPTSDEETDQSRRFTLPSGLPERTAFFTEKQFEALPSDDHRPMLVALHGLTGGSHEVYLRKALAPLVLDNGGWEACVVNARGCAQTKLTSSVLFNARATWDVRQVVRWLRNTFPNRPLFGIGFSLGANILTNVGMPDECHIIIARKDFNQLTVNLSSISRLSISERRVKIASYLPLSLLPIRGTWTSAATLYKGRGPVCRSTQSRWVLI